MDQIPSVSAYSYLILEYLIKFIETNTDFLPGIMPEIYIIFIVTLYKSYYLLQCPYYR